MSIGLGATLAAYDSAIGGISSAAARRPVPTATWVLPLVGDRQPFNSRTEETATSPITLVLNWKPTTTR